MATGNKSSNGKDTKQEKVDFKREVILLGIVAVSLLLFISNFGVGGKIGGAVSSFIFGMFGLVAYAFPILLMLGSFFAISNKGNIVAIIKLVSVIVFSIFLCMFLCLLLYGDNPLGPIETYKISSSAKNGGGFMGGLLTYIFVPAFGIIGSYIINFIILIIALVFITEKSFIKFAHKESKKVYESAKETNKQFVANIEERRGNRKEKRTDRKFMGVSLDTKISDEASKITSDEMGEIHVESYPEFPEVKDTVTTPLASDIVFSGDFVAENEISEPEVKERKKRKAKPSEEEVLQGINEIEQEILETASVSEEAAAKPYVLPPIDLLTKNTSKKAGNTQAQLKETATKLEQTLQQFGVGAKVTEVTCGPTVTRYEIQPDVGVKVSKIVNLADDIKLNLAAADIRIEAPIPGKAAVGIEVPNSENVMVSFRELVESAEFEKSDSKISVAVGKDIAGNVMVADIAKMPHLLIAGATGSGKSVCINTIIMSILYKANPDDVKLILIDPKMVELNVYNGIPHLMIPVVTDPKKAAGALNWAVSEMMDRYQKFADEGVRDFKGYNQRNPLNKLPLLVIIVDELADLMMVASKDVEESICRLSQLARAAGIHLIIATQRPSVNVITGLIKANMPSRIAFAVTSGIDSRTILDMNGAEKLLGKGDMLYDPQGSPKPLRVQGAFVSDAEVNSVTDFIRKNNEQVQTNEDVLAKIESMQSSSTTVSISDVETEDDGRDSYFMEAARIVIDKDKASIGMLQRYLKVGFNRAARIMDQLEEAGIVGPELGTKPRTVLMDTEQFESFIDENQ